MAVSVEVHLTDDPAEALDAVRAFLESDPVHHNLVLTLLTSRASDPEPGRYAWVVRAGEVVGVWFRSPPSFFATTTPMPADACDALVEAVAAVAPDLSGVNADAATAARFAGTWATRLRTPAAPVEAQRLYQLTELHVPPAVGGSARRAVEDDLHALIPFVEGFHADTGSPVAYDDSRAATESMLRVRRVWLWEDEQVTSMVGAAPTLAAVGRVGPVYTPPEHRGRGYAAALTAHVTRTLLDEGATPILYTQLSNPTSNAVYQRLGYEPVAEITRYEFGPPAPGGG
jgi:predicted GNAT family acetyltransferase